MTPEKRDALDELIGKIRAGRITRRTFLECAMAVGLSSVAATSLLEACGGSSQSTGGNGPSVSLIWQSEKDSTSPSAYQALTDTFNSTVGKQKGIHVTWNQGPASTNGLLTKYKSMLRARNHAVDVMSIDVVCPSEFASNGWIRPIAESQWSSSERANYLPGPIQSCIYQGQLAAAPFRTDIGVIYYRTDLISTPPSSWEEMTTAAQAASGKTKYGYVWQAAQYEGLVCNFVEVLYGFGGSILDTSDSTRVTVNSSEAQAALTKMVSWVGTISPPAVTTYMEDDARLVWQNGNAAFMRNWPYAYALGKASGVPIANKFDIHPMLYGGSNATGHSCTGGWNLAINAYSPNADAAWEFMHYLLGSDAQTKIATDASLTGTLQSVYDDAAVIARQPLFSRLKPILQTALPRPVSPRYPDVSNTIQAHVYAALKKQVAVSDALSALASDLQKLVS
jgi:multiple sugar transport system substrate-binding protein